MSLPKTEKTLPEMYKAAYIKARLPGNVAMRAAAEVVGGPPDMSAALSKLHAVRLKREQGLMGQTESQMKKAAIEAYGGLSKHKYTQSGAPVSPAEYFARNVSMMMRKLKEQAKINLEQRDTD